ncbi:phospholipase D-like domain-containing protein [Rubrivirga sp.]|uniref:phospholipase D-like domain-containing protein n=1 Tax=Rubrivirga sp. TaxID=1885344 RepID=UPI003B524AFA
MKHPLVETLGRGWSRQLGELFGSAESSITVSSAYITKAGVQFLVAHGGAVLSRGQVTVLTDLSPVHAAQGSTDPEALIGLYAAAESVRLIHLPRLHGKVYVADEGQAIVTSGNLTAGGLRLNYEYGLRLLDARLAADVRRDVLDYAALGSDLGAADLAELRKHTLDARAALAEARTPAPAQERFDNAVRQAKDVLVRGYARGEPIHTAFARTVLYVLRREGPMTTRELHRHVQEIHPDLCDDENRVIEGENFGRKWKHAVRTAQQRLKQRGQIERDDDGRWRTSSETAS